MAKTIKEVIAELFQFPNLDAEYDASVISDDTQTNGDNKDINTKPDDGAGERDTATDKELKELRSQIKELQKSNAALLAQTDVNKEKQIDPVLAICGIDLKE